MVSIDSRELEALLDSTRTKPFVFVTVGSDHHRFDRLIGWLDEWLASEDVDVECVVQHGTADPPRHARGADYVERELLQRCMAEADIVVVQGGPMSIVESRRNGKRPIVVPRVARLDEVVDDHQVTFCRKLASQDLITLAEDSDSLCSALNDALQNPGLLELPEDSDTRNEVRDTVERIRRTADLIVARRRRSATPTVVLLGGAGRSGSTLLERLLAEAPGVVALGETIHLWERGLAGDELCGCGEPFSECPFWTKVGIEAFGGWSTVGAADTVDLRQSVVRSRYTPELIGPSLRPGWRLKRDRLIRLVTSLYRGTSAVADAPTVIDSSKHPAYAMLLSRARVNLRCVLVVRDPRAVAYSWQRSVRRPEVIDRDAQMPKYGIVRTALTWNLYAVLYQALRALRVPLLVIRYEDLMADPLATVSSVLRFADVPIDEGTLPAFADGEVELGVAHTVAGNPMRFRIGTVVLDPDEQWRTGLSRSRQQQVRMLTMPMRRLYGYR